MTEKEYHAFWEQCIVAFPALDAYVTSVPDAASLHAFWRAALESTRLSYATAALTEMVAGRIERPQYGWADFPSIVRKAALDLELAQRNHWQEEADIRDAVFCEICKDDPLGLVRVYNPWWVDDCGAAIGECQDETALRMCWRRWHATSERNRGGMHLPAICSCPGHMASRRRREFEKRTFNAVGIYSVKFCRWIDGDVPESIEEFRKWWAGRQDVTQHEGYVQEFAKWK